MYWTLATLFSGSPQVSRRAKIRGLPQLGTLGAGNHYAEIQVVEEVFDQQAAKRMGIGRVGQVRGRMLVQRAEKQFFLPFFSSVAGTGGGVHNHVVGSDFASLPCPVGCLTGLAFVTTHVLGITLHTSWHTCVGWGRGC